MSKVRLYGSTSGYVELAAPAVADDGTLTLPTAANGFGGLIAVETVVKTDVFSASLTSGSSTAITGLSISHALSDASNRLILLAQVVGGTDISSGVYPLVAFLAANGAQINPADSPGNRSLSSAINFGTRNEWASSVSMLETYSPASTSSITYDVRVRNQEGSTKTTYVNRGVDDSNSNNRGRHISTLTLMEVAV